MFRLIYTIGIVFILPFVFARLWWKEKRVPGYRIRWLQRLGIFQPETHHKKTVWIHAVSVGEFIAAIPLIRALQTHADLHIMVTTMTPTGSDRVIATFGNSVEHVYAPYDLPVTVNAFLHRVKPAVAVIMETELWPNLLHACHRRKVPIILANGRLSERSAKRYGYFPKTTKRIFNFINQVAAQSQADAARYIRLGLAAEKVMVTGSIKFDLNIPDPIRSQAEALKQHYGGADNKKIWIAASTHHDEEKQLLDVFHSLKEKHDELLLLIVPRHPERFQEVYDLAASRFKTIKRSSGKPISADTEVIIGDTMGEMLLLYGAADLAFVGGSLITRGGHNMIEAAAWGLPIVCGPHTFNFADIAKRLEQAQGMVTVQSCGDLKTLLNGWLENPTRAQQTGQNALEFARANRGAVNKLLDMLEPHIPVN